jgi:hypothetical protein
VVPWRKEQRYNDSGTTYRRKGPVHDAANALSTVSSSLRRRCRVTRAPQPQNLFVSPRLRRGMGSRGVGGGRA